MPEVTITVDDAHMASIEDVVAAVRASGVQVTAVHSTIGIISGTMDSGVRSALTAVRGVGSIEESPTFGVAPPDSPVQ